MFALSGAKSLVSSSRCRTQKLRIWWLKTPRFRKAHANSHPPGTGTGSPALVLIQFLNFQILKFDRHRGALVNLESD